MNILPEPGVSCKLDEVRLLTWLFYSTASCLKRQLFILNGHLWNWISSIRGLSDLTQSISVHLCDKNSKSRMNKILLVLDPYPWSLSSNPNLIPRSQSSGSIECLNSSISWYSGDQVPRWKRGQVFSFYILAFQTLAYIGVVRMIFNFWSRLPKSDFPQFRL